MISNNCLAEATYIEKDQKAPYAGVLFSNDDALKLRSAIIDKEAAEKVVQLQDLNINLYKSQLDIYKEYTEKLEKQNQRQEYEKYVWFGIGILATSLSVYLATKALR